MINGRNLFLRYRRPELNSASDGQVPARLREVKAAGGQSGPVLDLSLEVKISDNGYLRQLGGD